MNKLLVIAGCTLLGILIMPAILQPPARERTQEDALRVEGAKLQEALAAYFEEFGQYPPGEAPAIIAELRGGNTKEIVFFECPPERLNLKGELLDPWGTPYRITFESESAPPRIHSAGLNRFFEAEDAPGSDDFRSWQDAE